MHSPIPFAVLAMVVIAINGACTAAPGAEPSSSARSASIEDTPITVADAIRMVRIDDRYGTNPAFVTISPDGSKLATVVWRGDLERNVNVYSMLVFAMDDPDARDRTVDDAVLSIDFEGDSLDQAATPIDQLTFLADNRTVAFLGVIDGGPRQVYTIDSETGEIRALTRHPTDVSEFAVTGDAATVVYAIDVSTAQDTARVNRMRRNGVFPYDREDSSDPHPYAAFASVYIASNQPNSQRSGRQFFIASTRSGVEPTLVLDSDREPGRIPSLREFGLHDRDASTLRGSLAPAFEPDLARAPVPPGWSPIRWDPDRSELILRRADSLAVIRKGGNTWHSPRALGEIEHFNLRRPIATDGRRAVGVVDSPTEPPELAVYDLSSRELAILTDLNPQLRNRRYGEVEQIHFQTPLDSASTGWLVKPVEFEPGHRYPLVVLLANEAERVWDHSFLIDGRRNLSGHAAQPLAAHGFLVLYIGEHATATPGSRGEIAAVRMNVEGAVRTLANLGYVDTTRVGISGWSRSAWYTEQLLMHSDLSFAAATQIDGGSAQYSEQLRPYTDEELARIGAPLLAQAHGRLQFAYQGAMIDRLRALGKPADLLYFETAPHSTLQPSHRRRSLTAHVDWWRFWLQEVEDPDPEKAGQYRRWRELKQQQTGR